MMKRMLFVLAVVVLLAGAVSAYPPALRSYNIQSVGLGDSVDKVFTVFGPPQAMQIVGSSNNGGHIQLLYFRNEDSLVINLSDLPDNKVVQMEISGNSWRTNAPVQVGDRLDKIMNVIGKPDKTEDISARKIWMLEQAGGDPIMLHIIEKSSGDSALWYQQHGLYVEYDKTERVVKSLRIYDPLSALSVNVSKV